MYLSVSAAAMAWAWSLCQLPELCDCGITVKKKCDCGTVEGIGLDNSFKLQSLIQLHPVEHMQCGWSWSWSW
jgi:hypothetical protein